MNFTYTDSMELSEPIIVRGGRNNQIIYVCYKPYIKKDTLELKLL